MIKENLLICDFNELFNLLDEIKENFSFNLINLKNNDIKTVNSHKYGNYIILSKTPLTLKKTFVIESLPIKIDKLVENINIKFLKNHFDEQSEINLSGYKLNLNSRFIYNSQNKLNITQRETDIILFLKNSQKPVKTEELQKYVWGHKSKLETHTVETHIYRLRKKFEEKFKDISFIKSTKSGYKI